MAKKKEKKKNEVELLEEIKHLLILGLTHQKVLGKRIADVLNVDPAIISRVLAPRETKKKAKKAKK